MKSVLGLIISVCLPLKSLQVTSPFGYRIHPLTGKYAFHEGVDLRANGDTVFAIANGRVITAAFSQKIGIHLIIQHEQFDSIYGHLSSVFVFARDSVLTGQPIGITGATGAVTGEHLHFAIRLNGRFINPLKFLYGQLIRKEHEQEF